MTGRVRWMLVVALAALVGPSTPQDAAAQERDAVRAAVDQLFEGMRTAQPDLVRAVLAPGVRFAEISGEDGSITSQSTDGWVQAIGSSEGRWDEQIYDVEVQLDGAMASVWAPYTFYVDRSISHCGINSIELLRDAEGWKITQISDTRRQDGCSDPLGVG